mmetsp:Transcript_20609/g.25483  ORF Transcript_20609/g.25483 Transcript_20609/m.25483 type:complete len:203 (-) Transcript_20609:369-977(-)
MANQQFFDIWRKIVTCNIIFIHLLHQPIKSVISIIILHIPIPKIFQHRHRHTLLTPTALTIQRQYPPIQRLIKKTRKVTNIFCHPHKILHAQRHMLPAATGRTQIVIYPLNRPHHRLPRLIRTGPSATPSSFVRIVKRRYDHVTRTGITRGKIGRWRGGRVAPSIDVLIVTIVGNVGEGRGGRRSGQVLSRRALSRGLTGGG